MDPVKRKVISELFFAPSVVLPVVGGISAALLSWAGGGVNALTLAALAGILGGLGWMVTRIIFKVESITEAALKLQLEQQIQAENRQLDQLMRELESDSDPRTQNYLTLLRSLRDDFWELCSQPDLQQRSATLREKVGDVFDAAVGQLRETLRLARLAQGLTGDARQKIQAERESTMKEIHHTVEHLRKSISEFREIAPDRSRIDLRSVREELEASIRVAKRTEQRMREMEGLDLSPDDSSPLDSSQTETSRKPTSFIRE